jgi:hypothetical protein
MKKVAIILATMLSAYTYGQADSTCNYRVNEVDEFTGTSKLVTTTSMYVEHTDSTLLKYYKNKKHSYFELSTYCAKINNLRVIYTSIRVDTKDAYKYFGSISTGAKCIFKFEDGETLTVEFAKYDTGNMNYDGGYTTYSPYLIISDEDYETLRTKKVDKLRIYWSKGYEDYTVDFPEVLINQLNCVK